MNIVIEYDSSVNSAPAGFKTAVQAAVSYFDSLILTPVSVPILFSYGELDGQNLASGALGESSTNGNIEPYANVASLLTAVATSTAAYQSLASLPTSDPTNGGRFWVSDAQAKALGLGSEAGYTDPEDGFVALGSSYNFTYDPNNRAVAGAYDAVGVLEHEISEALGRISYLGTGSFEGYTLYSTLDMFRYSSSGVHELTNTAGYFSVDGQTMLQAYNDPSNGGDAGDWATSAGADAFGAFTPTGVEGTISRADMLEMNLLGFQVNWGASSDFTGSGDSDILWRDTNGDVGLWTANAAATYAGFAGRDLGIVTNDWTLQQSGDFNGDGKADILWRNTNGDAGLWLSNTGLGFNGFAGHDLGIVSSQWTVQGVSDFNGDGKADILWRNTNGDAGLWLSNPGSGFAGFSGQDLGIVSSQWTIQGVGDFNGDGKADILWRSTNGDAGLWLSNPGSGFAGFSGQDLGIVSSAWTIQGVGDFNGDGKADILWREPNGDVGLWLSNPGSGFTGFTGHDLGIIPPAWTIQQIGDFNGDGKADMLLRDSQTGDVEIWLSSSGSGFGGFTMHDIGVLSADWHIA